MKYLFVFLLLFSCSTARVIVLHDPLTPEEHINLGVINEKKGDYKEAMKQYKIASDTLPIAYFYMGNLCFKMKDYVCAEKNYKETIKRIPQSADAMNNLAWLYYTIGENLDIAMELVKEAIRINPAKKDIYEDTLERIKEATKKR